jgi:toxin ParE1/3/4
VSVKAPHLLPRAQEDVTSALDHYRDTAGPDIAERFARALAERLDLIARQPGLGSPGYATRFQLEGLRCLKLSHFPYLLFYVERAETVDILRLLHNRRDIPGMLHSRFPD